MPTSDYMTKAFADRVADVLAQSFTRHEDGSRASNYGNEVFVTLANGCRREVFTLTITHTASK